MSDKKSDDTTLSMPAAGSHANGNGRAVPFPVFAPAKPKTDALKGITSIDNNRGASVLAYCLSSMSMTIVNKYVVSGSNWNMNLLYLAVQVRWPPWHVPLSRLVRRGSCADGTSRLSALWPSSCVGGLAWSKTWVHLTRKRPKLVRTPCVFCSRCFVTKARQLNGLFIISSRVPHRFVASGHDLHG